MELEESAKRNICVVSSNNFDLFPSNSRTHFINHFATVIRNQSHSQTLYARLKAVGLSVDRSQPSQPGYVKVQLYEIADQLQGRGFNRLLGGFKHPQDSKSTYTFTTFGDSPYLPFRRNNLDQVHVLLTDVNDKGFRVEQGPPTIVLIEIVSESMMEDEGSFTITCRSNDSENVYTHNKPSHFTSALPEMFDLKNYEVCLLNVVYPNDMSETCKATIQVEQEFYTINLKDDVYNLDTFLFKVNMEMHKGFFGQELTFSTANNAAGEMRARLVRERMPDGADNFQKPNIQVTMSWTFLQVLGETNSYNSLLMMRPGQKWTFDSTPSYDNAKPNPVAMLMCDAIKPGWVGTKMKQLLACLPVTTRDPESRANIYQPAHLHFVDVKETPFSNITFEFVNPGQGLLTREFLIDSGSDESVTITLSFRPKRK
jgi:hypothetical protein